MSKNTRYLVDLDLVFNLVITEVKPWHSNRIGNNPNFHPTIFTNYLVFLHSSCQGPKERADYFLKMPEITVAYLVFFSAITWLRKNRDGKIFEDLVKHLGYDPTNGWWKSLEKRILDRLVAENY